jgi:hypothetical protein
MQVKSMVVTDYSTGTQYKYNGQEGTWQSIEAVGGRVNSGGSGARVILADVPAPTSSASGMPVPFQGTYRTPTTVDLSPTAYPGLPSGWVVTSSGKVLPPSSAPVSELPLTYYLSLFFCYVYFAASVVKCFFLFFCAL